MERDWRQLIDDAGHFLDRWGAEASRLGWKPLDMFGVHPLAPAARYDVMGLALLIRGGEVVGLDERSATIRAPGGSLLTYLRRPTTGAVALWDLVS